MTWISIADRVPSNIEEEDIVLAVCLVPFFGKLVSKVTIAYFDMPDGYSEIHKHKAQGWKDWQTEETINVTHWQPLPTPPEGNKFDGMEQSEFFKLFSSWRAPLGSVW